MNIIQSLFRLINKNNNDDEELENILIAILYQLVNDEFKGKDIIELIMRTQVERIKDKLFKHQI